jgi:hypothetical protein
VLSILLACTLLNVAYISMYVEQGQHNLWSWDQELDKCKPYHVFVCFIWN